jgi:hypothetical protein
MGGKSIAAICLLFCQASAGSELDCNGEEALVSKSWDHIILVTGGIGEWKLPVSSKKPDVITEAKASLKLVRKLELSGSRWYADLRIDFKNPEIIGSVGFNFSRARIEWNSGADLISAELDWTNSCTSPGPALYPNRGPIKAQLELTATENFHEIRDVRFRLWGSQTD